MEKRPDLSDEGSHLPLVESGLTRSAPPREFSACGAVTLGDAQDDSISDPKKIIMKSHSSWGHASAWLTRMEVRLIWWTMWKRCWRPVTCVRPLIRRIAFQFSGSTTASAFNEKVQVDLLFLDDLIVMHAMDVFSKYSLLRPAQSGNPEEVWGVVGGIFSSQVQSEG